MWLTDMRRDDLFWRSSQSGGRATFNVKRGKKHKSSAHAGDIVATHPLGHCLTERFLFECKFYKELNVPAFVYNTGGTLSGQWDKTRKQARAHGKLPLMLVRENRRQDLLLITTAGLAHFEDHLLEEHEASLLFVVPWRDCFAYSFDKFVETVDGPGYLAGYVPRRRKKRRKRKKLPVR